MKEDKVSIKQRREEPLPTVEERETQAVLVAVIRDSQNPDTAMEYLDELEFLAETANTPCFKISIKKLGSDTFNKHLSRFIYFIFHKTAHRELPVRNGWK